MKIKFYLPLILIAIALGGCPYASEVPIDQAGEKIEPALLGTWEPKNTTDDFYKVSKSDEMNYVIEKRNKKSKDITTYRAFTSTVDGDKFLNLIDQSSNDKNYYLFKLVANTSYSKITLIPVTENIDEKFATSAELKDFIKKYKNLSFFFGKDEDVYNKAD